MLSGIEIFKFFVSDHLNKTLERFFRIILGEFSENLRINRKPWGNDFELIS